MANTGLTLDTYRPLSLVLAQTPSNYTINSVVMIRDDSVVMINRREERQGIVVRRREEREGVVRIEKGTKSRKEGNGCCGDGKGCCCWLFVAVDNRERKGEVVKL
ncbi:hypothetical protein ACFE04_001136 [Oxalis oulophora]